MANDDVRNDDTPDQDRQGDGALGPGTTAGGGAVRAGERVDEGEAGDRDPSPSRDPQADD